MIMPNKMTLKVFIHETEDSVLIKLCNELYDYKYVSGKLPPDGVINTLTNGFEEWDLDKLEKIITNEATQRYENIALLLIKNNPTNFFK
jgi:hypothetical protein